MEERTTPGLHDFLFARVLRAPNAGGRALDLAAGTGALATRLSTMGWDVTAVELDGTYEGPSECLRFDLDEIWPLEGTWDLVIAVEIIEHMRSPVDFLRKVRDVLAADGTAVVTTPNVDSLSSRLRFALKGKIRSFDDWGDPTHLSPIFMDLLTHRLLPRADLQLDQLLLYPQDAHVSGRQLYNRVIRAIRPILRSPVLLGDNLVLVLGHT